jgi:hypothetical protein
MHSIAHNDNFYAFARIKVAMKLAVKLQVIHGNEQSRRTVQDGSYAAGT